MSLSHGFRVYAKWSKRGPSMHTLTVGGLLLAEIERRRGEGIPERTEYYIYYSFDPSLRARRTYLDLKSAKYRVFRELEKLERREQR